jgi:prepilin-type processing-associated H-X9-DG protein
MCPSDTGFNKPGNVHQNRHFENGLGVMAAGLTPPLRPGVSNYIAIEGHRDTVNGTDNTGLFWGNSSVNMADILDGTSNTLAVGERETKICRSGTWLGVSNPDGGGARGVHLVLGHSHPKLNQDESVNAWNDNRLGCGEGFTSFHPGGAQFALADGSVRFLAETINHFWFGTTAAGTVADSRNAQNGLYQRLMTRDDGLPVSGF